jgi:hypothetical protein
MDTRCENAKNECVIEGSKIWMIFRLYRYFQLTQYI